VWPIAISSRILVQRRLVEMVSRWLRVDHDEQETRRVSDSSMDDALPI